MVSMLSYYEEETRAEGRTGVVGNTRKQERKKKKKKKEGGGGGGGGKKRGTFVKNRGGQRGELERQKMKTLKKT